MKRKPRTRFLKIKGKKVLIDEDDFPVISRLTWHIDSGYATTTFITNNKKTYKIFMHRLILQSKRGYVVDHKNGNRLDNRKENLQYATHSQNSQNQKRKINKKSGFLGVEKVSQNSFRARLSLQGKKLNIGWFKSAKKAALAYDKAALVIFGRHALTNKKLKKL